MMTPTNVYFSLAFLVSQILGQAWGWSCDRGVKSHNATWGTKDWNDRLAYTVNPVIQAKAAARQSMDLEFPPEGLLPEGPITLIEVMDFNTDGRGGCAFLIEGGVGHKKAKIHLKTQTGQGLNMRINFYTRPGLKLA